MADDDPATTKPLFVEIPQRGLYRLEKRGGNDYRVVHIITNEFRDLSGSAGGWCLATTAETSRVYAIAEAGDQPSVWMADCSHFFVVCGWQSVGLPERQRCRACDEEMAGLFATAPHT